MEQSWNSCVVGCSFCKPELFTVRCGWHLWMTREKWTDIDEEVDRELMGREGVAPSAPSIRPLGNRPARSGVASITHTHSVPCVMHGVPQSSWERHYMKHDHKSKMSHWSDNSTAACFPKTEESAPTITVLVANNTVYNQTVAITREGKHRSTRQSHVGRIRTTLSASKESRPVRQRYGSHFLLHLLSRANIAVVLICP